MPEPQIVKIVISSGPGGTGVFPNTSIQKNDSVFWVNNTSQPHQPAYTPAGGQQIPWGTPPSPLPPNQSSSQVVFDTAGTYNYSCSLHPSETGQITVS
ncbi:MAG TPA: plastocyanin/azurin family copper-binding protein [Candidatus Angelobacter sp.]|jgi:plastocyanin|nr:plastocyanin/azurin family copper-binding protein [Candidatus Angelobacter sp.]